MSTPASVIVPSDKLAVDALPTFSALYELASLLRLPDEDALAIRIAAAVDAEAEIGRTVARLQEPIGRSRPTVAFLSRVAGVPVERLISCPALTLLDEGAPIPERPVAVSRPLLDALMGRDGIEVIDPPDVPLPP